MRPIPIPDWLIPAWGVRKVIAAPDGDLLAQNGIAPVEAIVSVPPDDDEGRPMYTMLIQLEEGDVEAINAAGGRFLLTMQGGVIPFHMGVLVEGPGSAN